MENVNGRLSATPFDLSPLAADGPDHELTDWDVHHLLLSLRGGDSAATRGDAACCTDLFNSAISAGAGGGSGGGGSGGGGSGGGGSGGGGSGDGLSLNPRLFKAERPKGDDEVKSRKKIKLVTKSPIGLVASIAAPPFAPPRVELPSASLKALEVPSQVPAVSEAEPATDCLVLTDNQKRKLHFANSPLVIFNIYAELYPEKRVEIKSFISHVFHQYYRKNLSCTIAKEKVWWNEFKEEVREVCGFEFPIFQDFLIKYNDEIMCVIRNLNLYKPGVIENYFLEIEKREKMPARTENFIRGIISIYGTSLGVFKSNSSFSV